MNATTLTDDAREALDRLVQASFEASKALGDAREAVSMACEGMGEEPPEMQGLLDECGRAVAALGALRLKAVTAIVYDAKARADAEA